MEFFAIADVSVTEKILQERLTIDSLPKFCVSIETVIEKKGNRGLIFCLWGEFRVHREIINGGIRYTLPGCPNALAWTITTGYPPEPDKVVIHCTINRTEHEPELIESIETFVNDWKSGLEAGC